VNDRAGGDRSLQRSLSGRIECYSTYSRGVDGIWGMYQWLDRAPRGRNETGAWWRRHDEYAQQPAKASA